ncbi:hypothetical protein LEP1GSC116_3672 [Leptospira interrogans serovar Icterohaemorrhagiae str. Verdun HP]|uniref:Uncharacterized protein n=3 Tax=Leptospira interrogans TaxID=173 RepID=M6ZN82_LEPIR|nr:hypothetical protein LEP1GSC037_0904 [Leptospira interrogans str. 2006001854]EMN69912.1 hypothetical protein LEP1GSC100_4956 [Leptospira interrogans serovar Bataviae str. UI 08561]EMO06575.1 hypothetical protein LEP1GSC116_3672 [Leptospira interrogans serovar Icterohaemorrhagiae str. Verdun HP]EMO35850.1 hypothetical protein LEP1GSC177_1305 [Leptospira interrogans str. MMD3731]EMO94690.1 hypothetical protein LEP1GSC109_1325 [Leptospira interrogans str. UI 13372]EMP07928.1 hypothetical prote
MTVWTGKFLFGIRSSNHSDLLNLFWKIIHKIFFIRKIECF